MQWFDNETETYFEEGNKVIWHGDDEMTGVLTKVTDESFSVLWDDNQQIEYSNLHQDAIKKH